MCDHDLFICMFPNFSHPGEAEKKSRFEKSKSHVQDMMATRDYYRDRKVKREEIVAQEFLKKAVRDLYIEAEDKTKKKVHIIFYIMQSPLLG